MIKTKQKVKFLTKFSVDLHESLRIGLCLSEMAKMSTIRHILRSKLITTIQVDLILMGDYPADSCAIRSTPFLFWISYVVH